MKKEEVKQTDVDSKEKDETVEDLSTKLLNEILDFEIPCVTEESEESKEKDTQYVKIKEVIDPKRDIWFSNNKKKPIINDEGFKKLAKISGATFPDYDIIEKQSDYKNVNGQVWIEASVKFPNGEINKEYGIANAINCSDPISKANMPIMALKRARSRAFFRSQTINLSVFDESEIRSDIITEFKALQQQLEDKERMSKNLITSYDNKFKKLFNLVVSETEYNNKLIWKMNDTKELNEIIETNKNVNRLQEYVIRSRIRFINNNQNNNIQK